MTKRDIDKNGFMTVSGCPISSFGLFDYGAGQLGLPGDPNRIVKVYRPESAVSDPAAIESFKNVPFIVDHTMLSGFEDDDSAEAPDDKGLDGVLTSNVYYDQPWMRGDLRIFSRRAQAALKAGKKDLSLGYSCDFEIKPGVFEGVPYEVVQTNMRGNHIALVDEGRVPGARVLDGLVFDHLQFDAAPSDEDNEMKTQRNKKAMDNAVQKLKELLPALEQFLSEEAEEPAHQDADPEAAMAGQEEVAGEPGAAAVAEPEASAEAGEEQEAQQSESGLPQLISEVEQLLAKLKAACSAQGEGADEEQQEGADTVEGLEGTADSDDHTSEAEDEDPPTGEGQGRASPGPAAGKHESAEDAAVRRVYADIAAKTSLYDRLSPVVGAFDHSAMDANQVRAYGVKKLGIKCKPGTEGIALDAYLSAVEKAKKDVRPAFKGGAQDSAPTSNEVESYLG